MKPEGAPRIADLYAEHFLVRTRESDSFRSLAHLDSQFLRCVSCGSSEWFGAGSGSGAEMAEHADGEEEWARIAEPNWRGLGLTDPIKSVEVRRYVCVCPARG